MVHGSVSIFILISSVFMVFFAYKIVSVLTKEINLSNALFYFMLHYVVFAYIGSVIFNVWFTPSCIGYGIYSRPEFLIKTWIVTSLGLFLIPLFTAIFYRVFNYQPQVSITRWRHNDLTQYNNDQFLYFLCCVVFSICLIVFFLYVRKIGGLPIIKYLQNRNLSQASLRSMATNNFSGHLWRYTFFYETIPIVLIILTSFFRKKGLFFCLVVFRIITAVMNFEKGPFVNLVLLLILIYCFQKKNISFRKLFLIFILMLCVLVFMYIFFMNSKSIYSALLGMIQRIFTGQIDCFPWYFRYAEQNGFLYGRSFSNPANIFPFNHVNITVEVMNMYYESIGRVTDVVGSMPTVFMADFYVNFGFLGVFVSFLLFSFLLAFIDAFYMKRINKNGTSDIFDKSLYIYFIYYFSRYSSTSFMGILFDEKIYFVVFIIFALKQISKNKKVMLKYRGNRNG